MRSDNLQGREHAHTFGQDTKRPGESRTRIVIALTAITMVAEVAAGLLFGSMALLADGLHMASHATALTINALAYAYARRHAGSPRYSFGTGKVNALGGFTGAVLLATFAALMAWQSTQRLIHPMNIAFNQAIFVAVLGLIVNGISVVILDVRDRRHERDADHPDGHHHDHNLRSAYLHVMADALTSVLAIAALLSAKYLGLSWMDPAVGIVGAILVARWSVGLLRGTSDVLLDRQGPARISEEIKASVEADLDSRVADLHLWCVGPGIYAAIITVVAQRPSSPDEYKSRIPPNLGLVHVSIEVCECKTSIAGQECERSAPAN
jgi:cation diffusion facilitator family transporter